MKFGNFEIAIAFWKYGGRGKNGHNFLSIKRFYSIFHCGLTNMYQAQNAISIFDWRQSKLENRVSRLGSVTARHCSSGRQPNFAALNRGRHLYSAGRPSCWPLAHILVMVALCNSLIGQTIKT